MNRPAVLFASTALMSLSRRTLLTSSAAVAAGALGWSRTAHARANGLRVSRHRIPWPGPRKIRILHYTDVHVGWGTPQAVLHSAAELGTSLEPDAVVLTGDYVNSTVRHVDRLTDFVKRLPRPVFAVLGNHDHWSGAHEVAMALIEGGAEVLSNSATELRGANWSLPIVGVDDGFSGNADVARAFSTGTDPERTLVLNHFPNTADEIAKMGAKLILSGHTHGGQLVIPGLTRSLSRLVGNRYFHGWYTIDDSELYVSAGIGQSLEGLRSGESAVPEIAVYELDPSARTRESRSYAKPLRLS